MTKEDFEEKLNALVPQPDPEITAALFAFGQELGQEEACDGVRELLNSMSFVSRHFSAVTTQSVYEIIQHGSAALPGEMVAAAVYLENGNTLQDVAEMADLGMLMCFHCPRDMEELSPLALCVVTEGGHSRCFHTLHFGAFDPDTTQALSAVFSRYPAAAARLTFDADRSQTAVEYNPLWLELRQKQGPAQSGMQLTV